MPKWFPVLLCAGSLLAQSLGARTSLDEQRTAVTWALTYGAIPTSACGVSAPAQDDNDQSISAKTKVLSHELEGNAEAAKAVAQRAWADTFGPNRPFESGPLSGPVTYFELVHEHLAWLKANPQGHRAVIDDAYAVVLGRKVYDIEYDYWMKRDPVPYFLVTACIDGWARRNQPGLMATTGPTCIAVNSRLLKTLQLAPTVAAEARALLRGVATVDALATASGKSVIAPGAAEIISVGGVPFLALAPDRQRATTPPATSP